MKNYIYYCPDLNTLYVYRYPNVKQVSVWVRYNNWIRELADHTYHDIFLIGEL